MKTLISIVLTFKTNEAQMHSLEKTAHTLPCWQNKRILIEVRTQYVRGFV